MKKGFIGIFILIGIAFLAITFLKNQPDTGKTADTEKAAATNDSSRSEVIEFWNAYERATELRTAGRFEEALRYYDKALSVDPNHENSLYYRGNLLLRFGRFREAGESWDKLRRVNPSSARAYSQLGTLYSCRDAGNPLYDLNSASDHFAEAARLNREETGPLLQLAKLDLLNRNYERAGQKLNDVISSNFRSTEALFLKGFLEWRQGDRHRADSLLQQSLSIVKGTTAKKNVGEGDTEKGSTHLRAGFSRCNLYSQQIYRILERADPDELQPKAAYQTFDKELD